MIIRALKWLGNLLIFFVSLLMLVVLLTYALIGNESGFKFATDQLDRSIPGLVMEDVQGNILDGFQTTALSYVNDQMLVRAKGINSQWTSQIFGRKFDIETASIDELDIQLFQTMQQEEDAERKTIRLPDIKLPFSFKAETILIKQLKITPAGENAQSYVINNIGLSANAKGDKININFLQATYEDVLVRLDGQIELSDDYPLTLNLDTTYNDSTTGVKLQTKTSFTNSIEKLYINSDIQSPFKGKLRGFVQPLHQKLPAKFNLEIDKAGWPLDTGTTASITDLDFSINGTIDDYELALVAKADGANLPSSKIAIRGLANPSQVVLPEIKIEAFDGTIKGTAGASIDDAITWVANLNVDDLNPEGHGTDFTGKLNGVIKASGQYVDKLWSLDVTEAKVDGELQGYPLLLDAKLSKSLDNKFTVERLLFENGDNKVDAAGSLASRWDFAVQAELPQLQTYLPTFAGGFKANAKITGAAAKPDIIFGVTADVLKSNDLLVRGLEVLGDIKKGATASSTAKFNAKHIHKGTNELRNFTVQLDGTKMGHTINAFFDGPLKTSLNMLASGSLKDNFDWVGILDKTTIELPAHNLELQEPLADFELRDPIALNWNKADAEFTIDPHCWISQEATVCLENQVKTAATGEAVISIDKYSLSQLNPFLPAASNLGGMFIADTKFAWGDQYPGGFIGSLDAEIKDGVVKVTDVNGRRADFNYQTFTFNTEATATDITTVLNVQSDKMGNANVNVNMDPTSAAKDISGSVNLDGLSIGFLKAFLPETQIIEGIVKAEGALSGTLSAPKFDGDVSLNDIQFSSELLPLSINSGQITTTINGSEAEIAGALMSGEGNVDVSGKANWKDIEKWRSDIKLVGKDLSIVQAPLTSSTVNPEINIVARPGRVSVTGVVNVPSARIDIKELPDGVATLSPDISIVEDELLKNEFVEEVEVSTLNTRISVRVKLGDDVRLDAYGLDAQLAGDMDVRIRTDKPVQLGGELRIVKGKYNKYGQRLTIEDGQILFVGPIDQTRLNMAAVRTIESENRTAGLNLSGKISDPQVTLFTNPADKTDDSILSYIVLGRDIRDPNAEESSLLTSAIVALTVKGGRDVGKSIAKNLGIEEFGLETRGRGDETELVVSGRISKRLLVRYGRNIFDPQSTLYLRYDITKKLYLQAQEGVARAVDLFYSFSF